MSVTGIGASPYPTTHAVWSSQQGDGQADMPNDQSSTAVDNAAGSATNDNVTSNGAGGVAGNGTANATSNDANPLPPVQAATTPGTGQKVNIIA